MTRVGVKPAFADESAAYVTSAVFQHRFAFELPGPRAHR
jgi:hypothetical protein